MERKRETREERFKRVVEKRVNRIIKEFELLRNCSNKSNYEYTENDVKKIFNVIENELRVTKSHYHKNKKNFKFDIEKKEK